MTAGTILGALLQLAVLGVVGWGLGNHLLDRFLRDENTPAVGPPERALGALGGAVLFAVALMVAHIVSGGAIFGLAGVVPLLAIVVVVLTRRSFRVGGRLPWARLLMAAVVLCAIYLGPALVGGSSIRTGDPPWHLGWTQQLLDGEAVPTGPAPEVGRNAYPWGLHAFMATAVRLVPGSTPLVALEMLHLCLIAAIPLGAACLARRLRPDAGWGAAAAASLVGGFGWVSAGEADFVTSPSEARYGADLVVASPNSVYELFPPALPRELGLVMLAAAGWMLLQSARSRRHNTWVMAGVSVGMVGLISVPLFLTGLLWMGVAALFAPTGSRLKWLLTTGASAVATFALWAGPVASLFVRFGGFVNITPRLGKEWDLPVALASWGLLLPLVVVGVLLARRADGGRPLIAFLAASFVLLFVAVARGALDWDLAGNATLLHQGRMWPSAHLLGAVFGGVALTAGYRALQKRGKLLAPIVAAAVLVVGAASPVLASQRLSEIMRSGAAGFEYGNEDFAPGSFARRAAAYLGSDDVLQVQGDPYLGFVLFQLSGVKLASYDDPRLDGNDLRIRYADLAQAWDERVAGEGFDADFMVLPAPEGPYTGALVRGSYGGRDYILMQLADD